MFENLKKAVDLEIDYIKNSNLEQAKLPINERRKLGICLFPIDFKQEENRGNNSVLTFKTSYLINDSFFKKGTKVSLKGTSFQIEGRIVDLVDFTIEISVDSEEDINWRDEAVEINHIPDDRTLTCMLLGVKMMGEHPGVQAIINDNDKVETEVFFNENLNLSQQEAAGIILSNKMNCSIQGPPGTGKTHTLALAIQELVKRGQKVIVSAPSNTAVDNLSRKIKSLQIPVLRVGNEEKIADDLIENTIDAWLEKSTDAKVLINLKKNLQKVSIIANRDIRNYTKEAAEEKRAARKEVRELRSEIRLLNKEFQQNLIRQIPVIAGTPVGLFNVLPKEFCSDVVVLDEAGQCILPLAILVSSFGKRFVQCGDPKQLPPTIMSSDAEKLGLSTSYLELLFKKGGDCVLKEQYRMGQNILELVNSYFYDNQLFSALDLGEGIVQFIDMAGFGEGEQQNELGSTFNLDEVKVVKHLLKESKFTLQNTVILSPYSAQISCLKEELGRDWIVSTIDSIQGQEAENIIISLTRSNENQEIGFLKDYRRTNVAISRAKASCVVIGDSATIGSDPFYGSLIEEFESKGNYTSVWELVDFE